jgi:hypothetical protein
MHRTVHDMPDIQNSPDTRNITIDCDNTMKK